MEKPITNYKIRVLIIILLLYVPFLESYFGSTLWGLNWHSPEMMHRVGNYLFPIKILCVAIGLLLLARSSKRLKGVTSYKTLNGVVIYSSYFIGFVQIILLPIGLFFSSLLSPDLSYIHKEKSSDDYSIYVYTADPGAMGKAYHYFYIKCSKPFGRYKLTEVKKLDWMRKFDFEVKNSELLVLPKYLDEAAEHKIDLTKFNQCDANDS
jgi:hypothetical protein